MGRYVAGQEKAGAKLAEAATRTEVEVTRTKMATKATGTSAAAPPTGEPRAGVGAEGRAEACHGEGGEGRCVSTERLANPEDNRRLQPDRPLCPSPRNHRRP
jgi:hypothetical protein